MDDIYGRVEIRRNRREIRVLRFPKPGCEIRIPQLSANRHDAIQLILETVSLDDLDLNYTALSYTWGSEGCTEEISINGQCFRINQNLHSAIQQLRRRNQFSGMWIDAICINQQDRIEKSWQVAQMGDVYKNATEVIIWLGEAADNSEDLFEVLDGIGRPYLCSGLKQYFSPSNNPEEKLRNAVQAACMVTVIRMMEAFTLSPAIFAEFFPTITPAVTS